MSEWSDQLLPLSLVKNKPSDSVPENTVPEELLAIDGIVFPCNPAADQELPPLVLIKTPFPDLAGVEADDSPVLINKVLLSIIARPDTIFSLAVLNPVEISIQELPSLVDFKIPYLLYTSQA